MSCGLVDSMMLYSVSGQDAMSNVGIIAFVTKSERRESASIGGCSGPPLSDIVVIAMTLLSRGGRYAHVLGCVYSKYAFGKDEFTFIHSSFSI